MENLLVDSFYSRGFLITLSVLRIIRNKLRVSTIIKVFKETVTYTNVKSIYQSLDSKASN